MDQFKSDNFRLAPNSTRPTYLLYGIKIPSRKPFSFPFLENEEHCHLMCFEHNCLLLKKLLEKREPNHTLKGQLAVNLHHKYPLGKREHHIPCEISSPIHIALHNLQHHLCSNTKAS